MSRAIFHFHGRLNDFLSRGQREEMIHVHFRGRQTIKHLAESLGAPHPEIGPVQVNGQAGSVDDITQDGDAIHLYPIENGLPAEPRFILDCHLGRLTAHLRMLGFDCLYENDYDDSTIAKIIEGSERILLTRDRHLLMRKVVTHGYCPRSLDSFEQAQEVIWRFGLVDHISPFHRCIRCNHPLEPVDKKEVIDRLQPVTKKYFDVFQICPACKQIYWKGSHYEKMRGMIEKLKKDGNE